ncbi:MAG: hypothetical protein Q9165_008589 [Trypethelium subeluteriae]
MEQSLLISVALQSLLVVSAVWTAAQASRYLYNLFFHPLSKFPGPITSAASTFPAIIHTVKGDLLYWVTDLHAKYGDVVRVSPNELSFAGADSYRDIYGHKKEGQPSLPKDPKFYRTSPGEAYDVVTSPTVDHARMRRVFAHAFSDRALKLQEPLFLTYVDKLVQKLRDGFAEDTQRKFDMAQFYTYTTFDVMSDLAFGEPLDLLTDSTHHAWVAAAYAAFKFGAYLQCIRYFPLLEYFLLRYCMPKSTIERRKVHHQFCAERVDRRLEKKEKRPDIWGLVLERDEETGLSREEMYANASLFMLAGTETTAALLSGLTYHLLQKPETLQKLVHEIRSTFQNEGDIVIERLQGLKYLHACLEEGLRMFPPVPAAMPRVTTAPTLIDGREVPAGTSVGVTTLAAFRNANNFQNPAEFLPERWLAGSPLYAADNKQAFQPFITGPRGCLGKK